jgi:hypothetical protein
MEVDCEASAFSAARIVQAVKMRERRSNIGPSDPCAFCASSRPSVSAPTTGYEARKRSDLCARRNA